MSNPNYSQNGAAYSSHRYGSSSHHTQQGGHPPPVAASSMMMGIGGVNPLLGGGSASSRAVPRKYDSEPLHNRDRYGSGPGRPLHELGTPIHTPSYVTTNNSSAASSRTHSRTSTLTSVSHVPSPRSSSPALSYNGLLHTPQSKDGQQQQQQQLISPPPAVVIGGSSATTPSSRTLLHSPSNPLLITPQPHPSAMSSSSSPGASPSALTGGSSGAPNISLEHMCSELRAENQHLRSQLLTQSYELNSIKQSTKSELSKMRNDVTRALIAFESRLHLQLQQQLGFKPELEPMQVQQATTLATQAVTNQAVTHALTQIQQQLQLFEQSQQQTKKNSLSSTATTQQSTPTNAATNEIPTTTAGSGSPQEPTANAPAAPNMNLANLTQLIQAVNGLQIAAAQQQQVAQQQHQQLAPHSHITSLLQSSHSHHLPPPQSTMTEERLILLAVDILAAHGAVPVGKMGSLLHKSANDHTLPQLLKERYGGLKKFLQSQTQFFTLGTDHPYNPSLSLSAEFLAANPHIRPPEPVAPMPQPNEMQQSDYHAYYGSGPSLLQPLDRHSYSTSDADSRVSTSIVYSAADAAAELEREREYLDIDDHDLIGADSHHVPSPLGMRPASALNPASLSWEKMDHSANTPLATSASSVSTSSVVTSSSAPSTTTGDSNLNLSSLTNSPSLGASEASATANATFFSRLLG